MSNFCVAMPKTLSEYIMLLNMEYFLNNNNRKKIIIYKEDNNESYNINEEAPTLLKKYNLKDYNYFSDKIITNINELDNTFKKVNVTNLFLSYIINNKINININISNIFSQLTVTRFLMSKQSIKKLLKNKLMILLHINKDSLINIIYYILVIQCVFKLEAIKNGIDVTDNKITIDNEEIVFVVYSDNDTKNNNNILCQQFLHQLCLVLPKLKSKFLNGNKLFEEQIDYDGDNYDITKLVLYYNAYYVAISNQSELLFALSTYYNNSTTYFYPEKIIDNNFKQLIKKNISKIDYKKVTQVTEIEKRFINI